jgi:hypothetical protein
LPGIPDLQEFVNLELEKNASQTIIYASDEKDFAEKAGAIAQQYQFEMKEYLSSLK